MPKCSARRARPVRRSAVAIAISALTFPVPLLSTLPSAAAASAAETCIQPNRACTSWTPASGPGGTTVTITGRNWEGYSPGRSSEIFWGFAPNTAVANLTITPERTFSATIKVPDSAPVGKTSIDILGDFTVGRPLEFEVTQDTAQSQTLRSPTFQSPKVGQTLYLEDPWIFKVNPVDGASGYLWGFFQDGRMIWENYRDERKLSGTEYRIRPRTPSQKAFAKGDVQVWVRGLVDGKWTDATIITIHVLPKPNPSTPTPLPVPTAAKPQPSVEQPSVPSSDIRQCAKSAMEVDNSGGNGAVAGLVESADGAIEPVTISVQNKHAYWTNLDVTTIGATLTPARKIGGVYASIGVLGPHTQAEWTATFDTSQHAQVFVRTSPYLLATTTGGLSAALNVLDVVAKTVLPGKSGMLFKIADKAADAEKVTRAVELVQAAFGDRLSQDFTVEGAASGALAFDILDTLSDPKRAQTIAEALRILGLETSAEALGKVAA